MLNAIASTMLALLLLSTPVWAQTVTVAVGNWPPYTSEQDPQARIAQQIATEAFALEGVRVIFHYCPWIRCYREAEEGSVDATLPWFHSKKRDKVFLFSSQPLFRIKDVFFHLKGSHFRWEHLDDLKKYRLGGTLGYYDTDFLEAHGLTLDKVSDERLNFKKMLAGRIDAYATSLSVGTFLIHELFTPATAARFTHSPKPLDEKSVFVMFSRKSPKGLLLRRKFDQGFRKLKASGRYNAIFAGKH